MQPLAHRLRPNTLDEIIGQKHLTGEKEIIRKMIKNKHLVSMIFYGPPGTGKTTLASVLAKELNLKHRFFNAVTNNKKDLDIIFNEAKIYGQMVLIIDEVHRLNKDKQDLLLPHVESGEIILIGATTANPYFSINPAIRSRVHLFEIKPLTTIDIKESIFRALKSTNGLNSEYQITDKAIELISKYANGDIRYALNLLELLAFACENHLINEDLVISYAKVPSIDIDSNDSGHYDILSAFQKSIRGSDVNAALYYLAILATARDIESIERRLLIIAYEDIGLANPNLCARTISATTAAKQVGFPEAIIPLGLQVIDLCLSPKSKTANNATSSALNLVSQNTFKVPNYLEYTPVGLEEIEKYDYSNSKAWPYIQYLPNEIANVEFIDLNTKSQYESQLYKNYQELKKIKRTNNLRKLYSKGGENE